MIDTNYLVMGLLSDYISRNGSEDLKNAVNVEWVFKKLDQILESTNYYPIGTIYETTSDEDLSNWLGFTWERWGHGKVLVAVDENDEDFNEAELEGGEKKHQLTVAELARHRHSSYNTAVTVAAVGYGGYAMNNSFTNYEGNDQPHNNLQPYITVYRWRRTS
jgi:hypothetical protein